jgi:SSS family solute:Na+ symporter
MAYYSLLSAASLSLTGLDVSILIITILGIAAFGMYMGRREEGATDYFLAGRSVAWWAVAGSIFGSNVSSHHLVGMMGIGLSQGFAQANFEYGAIFGLMMLCFFFLPLYRRMGLYTLSEYLGRRYDDRSRLLYSITNIAFVTIQMCGVLLLGSVTINELTSGTDFEVSVEACIWALAAVAAAYTVFGGLKAVIYTDVVQSVLLLLGAGIISIRAIWHDNVGGLSGLMEKDADRFHVFFAADHPELPWTGVLTGLMVLHFNYWATNQFMVQRALGAKSGWDARVGIITAGYFKLLIPFLCIVPGMAAAFILDLGPNQSDAAFAGLARALIPAGYGLLGLVMAGLIGAILSTIDSMMNSSATLFTFDIYRKYIDPQASEHRLIWVGRVAMTVVVAIAIAGSLSFAHERSNIFLKMVNYESYLVPGVLVAFMCGIFHRFVTATGAFASILVGPAMSLAIDLAWPRMFEGKEIQAFHRVALVTAVCYAVMLAVSMMTQRERSAEREQYLWAKYRHDPADAADRRKSDKVLAIVLVALTLVCVWYFA